MVREHEGGNMKEKAPLILRGITRVAGTVEGEALVTTEKLSHLFNAVGSDGVIRMNGHPLMGQSYADKVIVYDTDIFSTGGAWGLYFKCRITRKGPRALICRTVHPISVGGAVDAAIPAVDGFDQDPCLTIRTGDWVKITAPEAGGEALVEVFSRETVGEGAQQKRERAAGWKKDCLQLTPYEEEMLSGKHGPARQAAMERLVQFGQGMGSRKMARIRSAHVFSDWKTEGLVIGAWPIYEEFARLGAKVVVPTTVESTSARPREVMDPT